MGFDNAFMFLLIHSAFSGTGLPLNTSCLLIAPSSQMNSFN